MTNLRTHRLVAILAALTLTAAACSSSTDNNVTADTVDDVAAVTEITELTTTTPTTTTPAMEDTMEEPTTTTVPTTTPNTTDVDEGTADITASQDTEDTEDTDSFEAWRRDRLAQKEADEAADNQLEAQIQENTHISHTTADLPAKNRHPDSVFPDSAYLDHDAIRALFPECPSPMGKDWSLLPYNHHEHDDHWIAVYENWDTEISSVPTIGGPRQGLLHDVASGWWTDEQIEMYYPGGGLTEASVRADSAYVDPLDDFVAYDGEPPLGYTNELEFGIGDVMVRRLLTVDDYDYNPNTSDLGDVLYLVWRDGMAGYNTTTNVDELGELVWNWMMFRMERAPIDEEPTVWGIRTLLYTRSSHCVAQQMLDICNGERETDSPLLEPSHRIGKTLRSLVCEFER